MSTRRNPSAPPGSFTSAGRAACTSAPPGASAGWAAKQIHDPVSRLRFLRAAAARRPRPGLRVPGRVLYGLICVFAAAALLRPGARAVNRAQTLAPAVAAAVARPAAIRLEKISEVWQVEATAEFETYSNGLRIDNRAAVPNRPRSYVAFPVARPEDTAGEPRTTPAGIVFHTSESLQAPFEASQNSALKRMGESLLEYVRRQRAYHFLIDRFGRVYRVVQESDAADHAGYSIWSDGQWFYLNLNDSFLGVSFEARTQPGQVTATVNPAQVHAAAML